MRISRRDMLGAVAAVPFAGTVAVAGEGTFDLRAALDAAARDPSPQAALDRLAGHAPARFTGADRLDLGSAQAGLAIDAELAHRFPFGRGSGLRPYRVTPFDGAWRGADPAAVEAETRGIEADAGAGVILPRPWLERTIVAIGDRLGRTDQADAALRRQINTLASLRARSPRRQGLAQLPNGGHWFSLLAERTMGSIGSMQACEQRLVAEKEDLHRRARDLFPRVGIRAASIGDGFRRLWQDPRYLYAPDEAGRAQAIADMTRTLKGLRAHVPDDFGILPEWCLDVSTRPLNAQEIAQGRKGYRQVPSPGHPGLYIADLQDIRLRPRWTLPAVVAHELLPGHMIQLGLEGMHPPHKLRQTYASSFVEGWGIYAEQLAGSRGAYPDPLSELGHIHWLLFRICRALVDIGIHLHGWSHAEALGRLLEWQGVAAYFAPFDTDLDRIALEPGLRLAEAWIWLALADRAAACSGQALNAFHRAMAWGGARRREDVQGWEPG